MNRPTTPLPDLLQTWAGDVATVMVVPVGTCSLVRAYSTGDDLIRTSGDEALMLATILRREYPHADWTVPQTWRAADGVKPTRDRLVVAS
ncbi:MULTISPECIES: hypothetical protein [Streptomyces]|uniref:hypothetical protein n=1 Tax=Streptomyces TaxID=1883 RepID=UPI000F78BE5A|nr:hypothetical protein [Streptomyces sp. WAC05858]RSS39447.1 hypothetical protein EF902_27555 [Streptomyces sp. WAC05858]WTA79289.1 hypothetical protein OG751_04450 [Streptomyces antimycoticus]